MSENTKNKHSKINEILTDVSISTSNKSKAVLWALMSNQLNLAEVETTLKNFKDFPNQNSTEYRKMLCAYDFKKYGSQIKKNDVY